MNFSPALQGDRVGGVGGGKGGGKSPQVKTQGPELPTDGNDHAARPKGHHSSQG